MQIKRQKRPKMKMQEWKILAISKEVSAINVYGSPAQWFIQAITDLRLPEVKTQS